MSKIRRNIKKYVENMIGYEEICRYIGFHTPYRLWNLEKFRALPLYRLWYLGKIPSPSFLLGCKMDSS